MHNWNSRYYYQATFISFQSYVTDQLILKSTVHDNYSRGKHLAAQDIPEIIQDMIMFK